MIHECKFILGYLLCLIAAMPVQGEVLRGVEQCGALTMAASGTDSGPYDYRSAPAMKKQVVESHHFTPKVEQLRAGVSSAYVGADLDFVLRYFPNHARALVSMTALAKREKTEQPRGSRYRLDCWYDRAVRMAPTDMQVKVIYGYWLAKKGERALALEQLDQVTHESLDSANMAYNLGLAYLEAGAFDKSLSAAHLAYSRGFPLPGLKNRLERAGKWREPSTLERVDNGIMQPNDDIKNTPDLNNDMKQ